MGMRGGFLGPSSSVRSSARAGAWLAGPPPEGLDTPFAESLSGYLQRLGNAYLIPPGDLLRELHSSAVLADWFLSSPRAMDGARSPAESSLAWLASVTGRSDLRRSTLLALSDLGGLSADVLLVHHKRWCPMCWTGDSPEPYERKLWNLRVVDVCPVHCAVLMDRCPACGRQPSAVSHDVRVGVCPLCGASLDGEPVVLVEPLGRDASRRLWFARQAASLIHAFDVAELLGLDASTMAAARREGLNALVASLEISPHRESVTKRVEGWLARDSHPTLDALFSVLWRAKWLVIELFPSEVRSVVDTSAV